MNRYTDEQIDGLAERIDKIEARLDAVAQNMRAVIEAGILANRAGANTDKTVAALTDAVIDIQRALNESGERIIWSQN